MSSSTEQQSNKPHRKAKAGRDDKKPKYPKGSNPKAFTSQSGAKATRLARQKVEKDQKRLHVPAIDRTFGGHGAGGPGASNAKSSTIGLAGVSSKDDGPPPVIVAVMGPPGVSGMAPYDLVSAYTGWRTLSLPCSTLSQRTGRQDDSHQKSHQKVHQDDDDRHPRSCHGCHWQEPPIDHHRVSERPGGDGRPRKDRGSRVAHD